MHNRLLEAALRAETRNRRTHNVKNNDVKVSLDDDTAGHYEHVRLNPTTNKWDAQASGSSLTLPYTVVDPGYTMTDRLIFIADADPGGQRDFISKVKLKALRKGDELKRGFALVTETPKIELEFGRLETVARTM